MHTLNTSSTSKDNKNRQLVLSIIFNYDLLYHQDIKKTFISNLNSKTNSVLTKLEHVSWNIVLILCESYLKNEKTINKRVDNAILKQSKKTKKPAVDHPWRRYAEPLAKHEFPSERVDKPLVSAETDTNTLSTLINPLPTVQQATSDVGL